MRTADETPYTTGLHEVADGVFAWLQPDGGWGWSNAGLLATDDSALLVDTLFDLKLTRAMLDAMESFSTYEVELIRQPPVISGDTATVETQLSFSARRKAGGTAQADGPATFEFRREGADWLIAQIDMSGVG